MPCQAPFADDSADDNDRHGDYKKTAERKTLVKWKDADHEVGREEQWRAQNERNNQPTYPVRTIVPSVRQPKKHTACIGARSHDVRGTALAQEQCHNRSKERSDAGSAQCKRAPHAVHPSSPGSVK